MFSEFGYYGIRTQDVPFEAVGDWMIHNSVIWIDGEETETELSGVCALQIHEGDDINELAAHSRKIYGDGRNVYTAIIASDSCEWGEDENEIILREPVVIKHF